MSYGINPAFTTKPACPTCGSLNVNSHYDGCLADAFFKQSALVAELRNRVVRIENMSGALWCDKGSHAFSNKDVDAECYTRRVAQVVNGIKQETMEEVHICGPCLKENNPFQPSDTKVKELEAWNDGFEKGKETQ